MNETQTSQFSILILERLAALEAENALGKSSQSIVELDQQAVGRLSRMDALQNQAMALAQQTRRDIQTRRLNAALARIDQGEYGYCEDCGEDIAPKRLQLDPAASKCISCASG
jgi:DnaK suppressor protein